MPTLSLQVNKVEFFQSGHKIDLQRIWKDNASSLSQDLNSIKHQEKTRDN